MSVRAERTWNYRHTERKSIRPQRFCDHPPASGGRQYLRNCGHMGLVNRRPSFHSTLSRVLQSLKLRDKPLDHPLAYYGNELERSEPWQILRV